ncbi:MAG: UvrD-helicase domain-containing protein [Candidatus Aegiribacteria sp.]|nr:UvrD-helicase domain-containing protein [Candidatus Aegiribacteria sp.]
MKTEMNPSDMKARETIRAENGKNVFIQASAGTGKTTLIVDRVMELLRIGIPLEKLAVVTFTNAAAAELRSRIREKLRSLKNSGEKEFNEALSVIPGAWITTIHGFASRVLREYFNFTGVDPAFSTTDGHFTPSEIMREWDAWLLRLERDKFWDSKDALIQTGTDRMLGIARGIEERRWLVSMDNIGDRTAALSILDVFENKYGSAIEEILDECNDHSDKLFRIGAEFIAGLKNLRENLSDGDYEEVTRLCSVIKLNSGSGKNWTDKDAAKAVLGEAREEFVRIAPVLKSGKITEQTWGFASSFAEELRSKWDSDRSRLSYNDLLYTAWKAISNSGVLAGCLSDKFDHILIDEFQDTSSDQVNLFTAFIQQAGMLPEGRITIVADDKQSIYGWRNADIETYRDFRTKLESSGAIEETITTNFRSSRKIVRFVNTFGSELFERQTAEEEAYGCDYSAIEPCPEAIEGVPVKVVLLPDLPDNLKNRYSEPAYKTIMQAEWFAAYLSSGFADGESPGDYALLMRSATHLHHFVNVLEREGIPYFVDATRDFRVRPEITDLKELLRCLLYKNDMLAWVHSLRSLFFGISDPVINTAIQNGTTGYLDEKQNCPLSILQANICLRKFRESIRTLPLADFLFELFFQTEMIPVIHATAYQEIRRLGNLQYILEQVLSGVISTSAELLGFLDENLSPARAEEPSNVPSDGSAVTLTTVHRAKGLAWKHVILAALPKSHSGRTGSRTQVISYDHDEIAAFNLGIPMDRKDKFKLKTPFWPEITQKNKARESAELRRLLYVAVTRPRESLVLFATPLEKPGNFPAGIQWTSLQAAIEKDPECCVIEEMEQVDELPFIKAAGSSAVINGNYSDNGEELFEVQMKPENWQRRGARIGDDVHAVLHKIDFSNPLGWFAEHDSILKKMYGDDFDEIRELSLKLFQMELPFSIEQSLVISREYPYIASTCNGLEKRYIDLLLRIENELVVVDYKTDTFDGRTTEQVAEQYIEKQQQYIQDVSRLFGLPAKGYLVFLREGTVFSVRGHPLYGGCPPKT